LLFINDPVYRYPLDVVYIPFPCIQFFIIDLIVHLVVLPLYLLPSWNLSSVGLFSILRAMFDSALAELDRISNDANITA
jgi:hypothetical protein